MIVCHPKSLEIVQRLTLVAAANPASVSLSLRASRQSLAAGILRIEAIARQFGSF
jgi:hypothetical protein